MSDTTRDAILGVLLAIGLVVVGQGLLFGVLMAIDGDGDGGYAALAFGMNPGISAVVLGAVGAFFLRKRRSMLIGFLVTMGLVALLNAGCWGVMSVGAY